QVLVLGVELERNAHAAGLGVWLEHQILDRALTGGDGGLEIFRIDRGQRLADGFEHEQPRAAAAGADAQLGEFGEVAWILAPAAPMQAIGEIVFALGLERVLRPPEGDDVVVDLLLGRYLDEHDVALAPVADRLDPQGRTLLEMRFEIVIREVVALALDKAEAARIDVAEIAHLQVARIVERAPDLLVAAVAHGKTVGIVHRRAEVIDADAIVGIVEEHGGAAADAGFGDVDTRIERHLRVVDGLLA